MKRLKSRIVLLAGCLLLLSGGAIRVPAQSGHVTVYHPGNYARTRQTMTNRAVLRAALKKKRARAAAARARRAAAARNH